MQTRAQTLKNVSKSTDDQFLFDLYYGAANRGGVLVNNKALSEAAKKAGRNISQKIIKLFLEKQKTFVTFKEQSKKLKRGKTARMFRSGYVGYQLSADTMYLRWAFL